MLSCISQLKIFPRNISSRRLPIEMINVVLDEDTGELMEYSHLTKSLKNFQLYGKPYGKLLGQILQEMPGQVQVTNTIFFIDKSDFPTTPWRDVIYGRFVVNYRSEKSDLYQMRLIVGGDQVYYPGNCRTPTINIFTVKLLLNSVVSNTDAKFMTIDITYFYLDTTMLLYEYMCLKLSDPLTTL